MPKLTEQIMEQVESQLFDLNVQRFLTWVKRVVCIMLAAYVINFGILPFLIKAGIWDKDWTLEGDMATWGQFGDYVGGTLNPLMAFGALYWLVRSVEIQRTELAATRRTLAESLEAQRKQTKEAEKMARINAISIILTGLNSEIETVRAKLKALLDQTNGHIPDSPGVLTYMFPDPSGRTVSGKQIRDMILENQARLDELDNQRREEINELHKLLGRSPVSSK